MKGPGRHIRINLDGLIAFTAFKWFAEAEPEAPKDQEPTPL
jgi:hypothetical protein